LSILQTANRIEAMYWEAVAHTDELTEIPNRRALDRHMAKLAANGIQVSIAVIDFDHFKFINDKHGHLAGDAALRSVAQGLLDVALSYGDKWALACRFGGDEFVFVAQMDASLMGTLCLDAVHSAGYKASIGVAFGCACPALFKAADDAVYQAKMAGRDRVVLADDCGMR
jgi:PleD family two-component response regulator